MFGKNPDFSTRSVERTVIYNSTIKNHESLVNFNREVRTKVYTSSNLDIYKDVISAADDLLKAKFEQYKPEFEKYKKTSPHEQTFEQFERHTNRIRSLQSGVQSAVIELSELYKRSMNNDAKSEPEPPAYKGPR